MKIHGNIHGRHAILLLNQVGHHAEQYVSWIITVIIDPILIEAKKADIHGNRSSLSYDS
jgi:hypothetical protein